MYFWKCIVLPIPYLLLYHFLCFPPPLYLENGQISKLKKTFFYFTDFNFFGDILSIKTVKRHIYVCTCVSKCAHTCAGECLCNINIICIHHETQVSRYRNLINGNLKRLKMVCKPKQWRETTETYLWKLNTH